MSVLIRLPRPAQVARVAYHEAGHAVAALRLGQKFRRVTIVPSEDGMGAVFFPRWDRVRRTIEAGSTAHANARIDDWVLIALAGAAAECAHAGVARSAGAGSDRLFAASLASERCGSVEESELYLRWMEMRARAHVLTSWPSVNAVAQALLAKLVLTHREADRLLRRECSR